MKRLFVMSAALAGLMLGGGPASAQNVVGSAHDLRSQGGTTTQVCVYCHTPHKADVASAVLWNRVNPNPTTFTMYDSPTLDNKTNAGGPQGVSLACLSCHDGATAFNSLINAPGDGTAATGTMSGGDAVGLDGLANDHPISMTYDSVAEPGLRATMTVALPLFGAGADQVECATCHNPHDQTAVAGGHFLRITTSNSDLCTNCHIK